MAQNNYGGPERGVLQWLPPKHAGTSHGFNHKQQQQLGSAVGGALPHGMNTPPVFPTGPPLMFTDYSNAYSNARGHENGRKGRRWAVGGPGMQAIFLGSGTASTGTGVFLPRGNGPDNSPDKYKPVMSPVLLPAHIVQALNLNVHELGQQIIKPRVPDETKNCVQNIEEKLEENPGADNLTLSREFNLPEEWTY